MLKNLEMLIRSAELIHVSEKFEFPTKECGALAVALRGGYHFIGCAAVANQLTTAWMWLAGAMPVEYGSLILVYALLFCETHDLVWKIIIVSEKRMKNCNYCEHNWQYFRNKWRRWVISFNPRPAGVWLVTRPAGGGGGQRAPWDLPNYWTDFQISNAIR